VQRPQKVAAALEVDRRGAHGPEAYAAKWCRETLRARTPQTMDQLTDQELRAGLPPAELLAACPRRAPRQLGGDP
jgi:hypothetical protein